MTTFKTKQEATAAGWVQPRGRHEMYRHFSIQGRDISGPSSEGYRFALVASPLLPYEISVLLSVTQQHFAVSHSLWLTEGKNQIGTHGSFIVRFHPQELADGIAAARAAIDEYYASNEEARAWESEQALRNAESDARARQRQIDRAKKLHAKYGDDLAPEWKRVLEGER